MRTLYNEFFYIPKHGKIREKVMLVRVATIIAVMIMCLVAMSITAFAWFSGSVVSSTNKIVAANYDLEITVDGQTRSYVNEHTVELKADRPQVYDVTIKYGTNSTASTGFCVIKVDYADPGTADVTYHTAQIGKDVSVGGDNTRGEYTLVIHLYQAATITFSPHWGTSSYYRTDGDDIYYLADSGSKYQLVLGETTQSSPNEQEQPGSDFATVPGGTTPPGNEDDVTTSTPPDTSDTTPFTEQTTSTSTTDNTTSSTGITEETTDEGTDEDTESQSTDVPSETTSEAPTENTSTPSDEQIQPATEDTEDTGTPTAEASEE